MMAAWNSPLDMLARALDRAIVPVIANGSRSTVNAKAIAVATPVAVALAFVTVGL